MKELSCVRPITPDGFASEKLLQFAANAGISFGQNSPRMRWFEVLNQIRIQSGTSKTHIDELLQSIIHAQDTETLELIYNYGLSIGLDLLPACQVKNRTLK